MSVSQAQPPTSRTPGPPPGPSGGAGDAGDAGDGSLGARPAIPLARIAQAPRHAPRSPANLESEGQSTRMRLGIGALAVALGLVLTLQSLDAPRLWRLTLFVPFFLTLFGATQALYRTCPSLASRGVREVCGSEEPVARASERQRSRQLGHRVLWLSTLGAVVATAVFALVP